MLHRDTRWALRGVDPMWGEVSLQPLRPLLFALLDDILEGAGIPAPLHHPCIGPLHRT